MSMNVKRFIIRIQAVVVAALGLLGFAASPSRAETPKVTMAPGQIIVHAAPGMSESDVRALAATAKCDFLRAIPYCPGFYVVRLQSYTGKTLPVEEEENDAVKAAIDALNANTGVKASPDLIGHLTRYAPPAGKSGGRSRAYQPPSGLNITPDDPLLNLQWGLRLIRMPEAWAIQYGIRPIVVGVADSGIDIGHPDFATPDGKGTRVAFGRTSFLMRPPIRTASDTGRTSRALSPPPPTILRASPASRAGTAAAWT